MKRYSPDKTGAGMFPKSTGMWVKLDEALARIAELERDAERGRYIISHMPPGTFNGFDVSDAETWAEAVDAAIAAEKKS